MALCDYMIIVVDGRLLDGISPYVRDLTVATTCNYYDSTKLVVCINRSDQVKTDFERNFIEFATLFHKTLSRAHFKDTFKIPFIPVSSKTRDGVFTVSKSIDWYKGPTLMDCINGFAVPTRNINSSPLRLVVDDYFHNVSRKIILTVKVYAGVVEAGDDIKMLGLDGNTRVKEGKYSRSNH
jgi:translation elongation factor EF-1alpha